MRGIVLCADDFGLTAGIDRGILALAHQARLSAISCMTGAPFWQEHAALLKPLADKVDIGLHITLVDEKPLTIMPRSAPDGRLPSIGAMIVKSHAGLLDGVEIEREITAQWDAFENAMGRAPDHVDGHLHTHVFPGIRDVVLKLAAKRAPNAWLRNIAEPYARVVKRKVAAPKAAVLTLLGNAFANRIAFNDGFSGVYGLRGDEDIPALFARFLETSAQKPVVLCHPGDCAHETVDCARARTNEYEFLKSDGFAALLAGRDLRLARFRDL
jgi:predicted glycoside hydrolase/deacetylase ChbG (UPF0249 family)